VTDARRDVCKGSSSTTTRKSGEVDELPSRDKTSAYSPEQAWYAAPQLVSRHGMQLSLMKPAAQSPMQLFIAQVSCAPLQAAQAGVSLVFMVRQSVEQLSAAPKHMRAHMR
jgi:hypothetical protein